MCLHGEMLSMQPWIDTALPTMHPEYDILLDGT